MKYKFANIENGQVCEGYTVIDIVNHEAEIADEVTILLAEKHSGELVPAVPKQRKLLADEKEAKQPKQNLEPEITEE